MVKAGRGQPADFTKAAVRVARTSQCLVLHALRTEQIVNSSSPLAEQGESTGIKPTGRFGPREALNHGPIEARNMRK